MLESVIFDFDGVIADTEILHYECFNKVLKEFGVRINKNDYYDKYLGYTDHDLFSRLIDDGVFDHPKTIIPTLIEEKKHIFREIVSQRNVVINGVVPFVHKLVEANILVAICSGALRYDIDPILQMAKLDSFFEIIVTADDVEKGKPDPEGYLLTLQKINEKLGRPVIAEECIAIEDSQWGLQAAKKARLYTIGVTSSYGAEELLLADEIVDRLDTLSMDNLKNLCD